MEKKQFIRDLNASGEAVDGVFLLASVRQAQARNGPYWHIELRDSSGAMESKIWSPLSARFPTLKAGLLAEVQGRVVLYRDRNEIAVESLRLLDDEQSRALGLEDFMPQSGLDSAVMLEELDALCLGHFSHAPWKKFYRLLLKDGEISYGLARASAAKNMHHAYAGGLLEHTLGVCRGVLAMTELYPYLDRQTLLAGALCHDLGKIRELSSGLLLDYTGAGRLLGHITLGLELIGPALEKSNLAPELAEHLRHLILSHHGSREFGSPCLPATAEALALHFADNLDAKLNQARAALASVPAGECGWSAFVPGLDRYLFQALPSPEAPRRDKKSASAEKQSPASQCSLLLKA